MSETSSKNGEPDARRRSQAKARDVCRNGEWSFTCRPLVHVAHTWVVERRALLGCEWTLLTSRRFGCHQDEGQDADDDVTWTISLEVDTSVQGNAGGISPRVPNEVRVCVAFSTEVPHKRVFYRAALRAQEEAVNVDETLATMALLDSAGEIDYTTTTAGRGVLSGLTRADPNQREHIGTLFLVDSDRALTVRVDIAYLADVQDARPGPATVSLRVPPCSLAADMEALMLDSEIADAVLVDGGGREWKVHKAILAARSPVFAAMFKHDMMESKNSRVTLDDVSGDVLQQVLRYIYTGRVDHMRTLGVDMLAIADRYQLPRLKALCEEELANTVSLDNALDVLATADLYAAKELQDAALQCVSSNIHKMMASPSWKELVQARPDLLCQILAKCVNYIFTD